MGQAEEARGDAVGGAIPALVVGRGVARIPDRAALWKVQVLVQFDSIRQMFIKHLLIARHCLSPIDAAGNKSDQDTGLGQVTF